MPHPRALVAVPVLLLVVSLLSGCAFTNLLSSREKEQVFDTRAQAAASPTALLVMPAFVPADAVHLRIRVSLDGKGELLRYASPTPLDAASCARGPLQGTPGIVASWWPEITPKNGAQCGAGWQAFQTSGTTFAWHDDTPGA
ncbi:hypothetical protein [Glaciihabitans sp. dw_435]|uniref:hypothetical protein n=1 Tax=Glaciihabitans sp. dw_435 TaxID=2720081 RepID=UPI001BD50C89|nr:hypothetical protein [Glaciihabitans sp. dw_435]